MSLESARHLLDEFNDGNWDEVGVFFNNDFEVFYKFLEKYGIAKEITPASVDEDYLNMVVFTWLNKEPKAALDYICKNYITDVYPMKDGYYLLLGSRDELAKLFDNSGRNYSAKSVAERVLGEDSFEAFDDTSYNIYDDVVNELDDKNFRYLADYILRHIGNQDLKSEDYESDFFHELAEEQNRDGFFQITSNDVFDLIKDEEAINELLKGDLSDLGSDMRSVHWNAYNSAYESEVYDMVWSELETYFIKDFEHETKELSSGKKRTYEYIKIRDFYNVMYNFLSDNQQPGWRSLLIDYIDNYPDFLYQRMYDGDLDYLDFRIPDYPDYTLVRKYINEYFQDYIY